MSTEAGIAQVLRSFSDPQHVARYVDGPPRFVPGLAGMHRMAAVLLGEGAPPDATILVLGAGGGLELRALADAHPGWRFVGVDPAGPMLELAARTLGPHVGRAELVEGYIEDAPPGPFDGATCLLTLHLLDAEARRRTARAIRARLKPGAPVVIAHGSFPQRTDERALWLSRYAAFAIASGVEPELAHRARSAVEANLHMLAPEDDEAILREAGFSDVSLFYAAFTWRGWIARA